MLPNKSVFMKKLSQTPKMSYHAILQTIPKESYIAPQSDKMDKIEIRWRFIHIPLHGKIHKVVEISKSASGHPREYLDKNSQWIQTTVSPSYDPFVVKQYFYYTDT
ncbi:MAG: hypothetical protein Hyperionvirus9_21 [Hyperionvirus sp.]|uniref:Uncharacterized protein n=1 Tax=Hyperionvirus sp. TaxID=2487770 RepID=A0A3G5AAM1_9VIRU|nr:MAG: hypothetical protein Hyperionvirus9_21 [Hyperionvirus sp.]